jgi:hypothetical protein
MRKYRHLSPSGQPRDGFCALAPSYFHSWSRTVLALLQGSATGRTTLLFLHEWSDLHPLRRATYLPFVALCRTIIMLSPTVKAGFQSDPVVRWARSKCRLALHAPPVLHPATRKSSSRVEQV